MTLLCAGEFALAHTTGAEHHDRHTIPEYAGFTAKIRASLVLLCSLGFVVLGYPIRPGTFNVRVRWPAQA
ncbi:MAG: hypothetical protein U1F68_00215 [Gammaproteobacteria bacterium]